MSEMKLRDNGKLFVSKKGRRVPVAAGRNDGGGGRARYEAGVNDAAAYTDDETEFLRAMDRWKHDHHNPYPAWTDVLDVLRGLGWRKPGHALPAETALSVDPDDYPPF